MLPQQQVNYVGKAGNLYEDAGYELHGSSYVIDKFLGTSWLWDRVRVVGGAYGGFCNLDTHSGMCRCIHCAKNLTHRHAHLKTPSCTPHSPLHTLHTLRPPCIGMFSYLSYRDPNLLGTVDVYDGTPEFLRSLHLSKDELTKAIIGTIGDMDSYQLPDAKGYTAFLRHVLGVEDEERQVRGVASRWVV